MSELKSCPCCKGEAALLRTAHAPRVYCTGCRLNTGGCETEEEAVEKWNRRATDSCEGCDSIDTEEWCGGCSRGKPDLYEPGGVNDGQARA